MTDVALYLPENITTDVIDIPVSIVPVEIRHAPPGLRRAKRPGPPISIGRHVAMQTRWYVYDGIAMRSADVPTLALPMRDRVAIVIGSILAGLSLLALGAAWIY